MDKIRTALYGFVVSVLQKSTALMDGVVAAGGGRLRHSSLGRACSRWVFQERSSYRMSNRRVAYHRQCARGAARRTLSTGPMRTLTCNVKGDHDWTSSPRVSIGRRRPLVVRRRRPCSAFRPPAGDLVLLPLRQPPLACHAQLSDAIACLPCRAIPIPGWRQRLSPLPLADYIPRNSGPIFP
jgi:hypothetical protein